MHKLKLLKYHKEKDQRFENADTLNIARQYRTSIGINTYIYIIYNIHKPLLRIKTCSYLVMGYGRIYTLVPLYFIFL